MCVICLDHSSWPWLQHCGVGAYFNRQAWRDCGLLVYSNFALFDAPTELPPGPEKLFEDEAWLLVEI